MTNNESDVYFGEASARGDGLYDFDSKSAYHYNIAQNLLKMQSMHQMVTEEMKESRGELIPRLCSLISNWSGPYPDLRRMFRRREMDWLLKQCVIEQSNEILDFVIECGYKDEPEVDAAGKPVVNRQTAVHLCHREYNDFADTLFQIYDRHDVNYTNKNGLTHFHLACEYDLQYDLVEKFLQHGQNPNCVTLKTGDSPLHLAADYGHRQVVELLLRNGANPNLANAKGWTPMHVLGYEYLDEDLLYSFFKVSEEMNRSVHMDAQDKIGSTPLHVAVDSGGWFDILLKNGANPNLANDKGRTPLHFLCMKLHDSAGNLKLFFESCDEKQQTVRVDAVDKLGWTPLQLAVGNFAPSLMNLLLDRGADLSKFIFPTESQFDERFKERRYPGVFLTFKLRLATGAIGAVECLEKRGYELDRSDALTIMASFAKHGFFEKSSDTERSSWYEDEEFVKKAKEIMINPDLTIYDLIRLPVKEVSRVPIPKEYLEKLFRNVDNYWSAAGGPREACPTRLSEIIMRRFCRRWALNSFLELVSQRLPSLCCEMVVEYLLNEDLWRICLAAAGKDLPEIAEQTK